MTLVPDRAPPDRAPQYDPLTRFRSKIGENARAWLGFVRGQRPESVALAREFANLSRAADQALREPTAWADALGLVIALWPFIDWYGYWLAWRENLERALAVCRRVADPDAEVEITDQLGELARSVGENRAALIWQEEALKLARRLGKQAIIGRVLVHLSQQHLPRGDYQKARACCEEAVGLLEPLGAEAEVASAHNNWGIACLDQGLMEPALAHLALAERMFAAQGNRRGQAKALHNQGEVYLRQERWTEAEPLYERAITIAVDAGDELGTARSRLSLAVLLNQRGQPEAALRLHREIEQFYRRLGDRTMLARIINNVGVFLAELDRWDEAVQSFDTAARMHLASDNLSEAATSLLNCAEILLNRVDAGKARIYLKQAADLVSALPLPPAHLRQHYAALLEQVPSDGGAPE